MNTVELSYLKFGSDTIFKQQILERTDSGWVEKEFNYLPGEVDKLNLLHCQFNSYYIK